MCWVQTGEAKMKQVQKFTYLGSVITGNGKCCTEIRIRIVIEEDALQK